MGFSSSTAGNIESKLLMSSSSTTLTSGVDATATATTNSRSLGDRIADRTGWGIPKFKSLPPPSLPISPNWVSPSSYFAIPPGLSPAHLLDSPVLLSSSSLLPSPTTGAFAAQALNWNTNHSSSSKQEDVNKYSDFTFQTQARSSDVPSSTFATDQMLRGGQNSNHNHQQQQQQSSRNLRDHENKQNDASSMKTMVKSEFPTSEAQAPASGESYNYQDQNSSYQACPLYAREQKKSDDGYNWRKYGQKQVKGSENPRSYYKCTYPNCPMKKKIERSLDGQITEIVYKGSHNHPKPVNTRRSSSSSAASLPHCNDFQYHSSAPYPQPQGSSGQTDSVATPENSSISVVDDELDMASQRSRSAGDDDEPDSKRWKGEGENECMSAAPGTRAVREPRVVVQTKSDIDILDDGYRWRKYGQKVVKGNPNPRSYYKCTHPGCLVRKHVERAAHDLRAVITTYEGKHNHEVPAARGSGINRALASSGTAPAASMQAIRPSALNYGHPKLSNSLPLPLPLPHPLPVEMINQRRDTWAYSAPMEGEPQAGGGGGGQLSPFTLEMLQNPAGFSGFKNQYTDMFAGTRTKEEPKEDMSFDSFLC